MMTHDSSGEHKAWAVGLCFAVILMVESVVVVLNATGDRVFLAIALYNALMAFVGTIWLGINRANGKSCIPSLWGFSTGVLVIFLSSAVWFCCYAFGVKSLEMIGVVLIYFVGLLAIVAMLIRYFWAKKEGRPICSLSTVMIVTVLTCFAYAVLLFFSVIFLYAFSHLSLW